MAEGDHIWVSDNIDDNLDLVLLSSGNGRLFYSESANSTFAIDDADGTVLWEEAATETGHDMTGEFAPDGDFICGRDRFTQFGSKEWTGPTGYNPYYWESQGAYIGSRRDANDQYEVVLVDEETGAVDANWGQDSSPFACEIEGHVAVTSNRVYIGTRKADSDYPHVLMYDLADGSYLGSEVLAFEDFVDPRIAADSNYAYTIVDDTNNESSLSKWDDSLTEVASAQFPGGPRGSQEYINFDETWSNLYLAYNSFFEDLGRVYQLDPTDLSVNWSQTLSHDYSAGVMSAIDAEGNIIVSNYNELVVFDSAGNEEMRIPLQSTHQGPILVSDGAIYIPTESTSSSTMAHVEKIEWNRGTFDYWETSHEPPFTPMRGRILTKEVILQQSDYVFESGEAIATHEHGQTNYVFESSNEVFNNGGSNYVFESSVGLGEATPTLIDSYEDGDVSEYSSANTGSYNVVTTRAFDGSHSLQITDGDGFRLSSASGLPHYPSPGDTIQVHLWIDDLQTSHVSFGVGWDSVTHNSGIDVGVIARSNNADFAFRLSGGRGTDTSEVAISDPRSQWLRMEIDWDPNNDHTGRLYLPDGSGGYNLAETVTLTSSEWTDSDRIGFHQNNFGSGGRTQNAFWDYVRTLS